MDSAQQKLPPPSGISPGSHVVEAHIGVWGVVLLEEESIEVEVLFELLPVLEVVADE